MPIKDPTELKLRIKRSKFSAEGKLLDYMMDHPTLSSSDAVMEACRAYWMPLAILHSGERNEAVLREVGWRAIGELEKQIELIKRVLHLEETQPGSVALFKPSANVAALSVAQAFSEPLMTPEDLDEELGVNDF